MSRMLNMIGAKILGGAILASQVKPLNAPLIQAINKEAAGVAHTKAVLVASDALTKMSDAVNGNWDWST